MIIQKEEKKKKKKKRSFALDRKRKLPKYGIPVELVSMSRIRILVQPENCSRITEESLEIFNFILKIYFKKKNY